MKTLRAGSLEVGIEFRDGRLTGVKFKTVVTELIKPEKKADEQHTSVDNSWINTMIGSQDTPRVRIAECLRKAAISSTAASVL